MIETEAIAEALKAVDVKKKSLQKAFEDLQARSSSLSSSFNLTWADLDSYFTSLQSSLEYKFKLLQSYQQQQHAKSQPQPPSPSIAVHDSSDSVPARPELRSFCERMDGLGLRRYISERPEERAKIRLELRDALRFAPDAAKMILGAMEGFHGWIPKGDKDLNRYVVRSGCLILLEELMKVKPDIGAEVKEKARKLATQWKGKVRIDGKNSLEVKGFLHLVAAYGLAGDFDKQVLVDFIVIASWYKHAFESCRLLGLEDRISDIVSKLISEGKQLVAVKFIFEFNLTDKFPPVVALKEYLEESKKEIETVLKNKNIPLQRMNGVTGKEISALKSVMKIINEYNLESEYPKENLIKRIEKIKEDRKEWKCLASITASKPQLQQQPPPKPTNKQSRTTAIIRPVEIVNSTAAASSTVTALQKSHLQPPKLVSDGPAPFMSSPAGPDDVASFSAGLCVTSGAHLVIPRNLTSTDQGYPSEAPYSGSSADLYGSSGVPLGIPRNVTPGEPHMYPLEAPYAGSFAGLHGSSGAPLGDSRNLAPTQSQVYPSQSNYPFGYFDGPVTYSGFGLPPHYHPSYQSQ